MKVVNNSRSTEQPTGSPQPGEPVFLVVGRLRRAHGLRGETLVEVLTDFPERLETGVIVYAGDDYRPLRIQSLRWHSGSLLMAFEGIQDPENAGTLRNQWLYVRADDRPSLPEGDYYHHQLLGLRVISDQEQTLGIITNILETGANDVYIVHPDMGPDILLPAIEPVILSIDLVHKEMRVKLIPGLLPE